MRKIYSILWLLVISLVTAAWSYESFPSERKTFSTSTEVKLMDLPISFQTYDYLIKYAKKYNVPFEIAFGIAKLETSYSGAFHWKYNPSQISSANAYGAMQVQRPTASYVWGREIDKKELLVNLEFNIETSMKYISMLHDRYEDWAIALGFYNTGYPIANRYALEITKDANLSI